MRRPRLSPARRIIRVRMAMGGTGSQLVPIASSERMAPSRVHEGAVSNRASSVIRRLDPSGDSTAMSYSQPGTRPTSRVARALHGSCADPPEEGRDGARRSEAAGRGPGRPSAEGGGRLSGEVLRRQLEPFDTGSVVRGNDPTWRTAGRLNQGRGRRRGGWSRDCAGRDRWSTADQTERREPRSSGPDLAHLDPGSQCYGWARSIGGGRMQFLVLGPLEVREGQQLVPLGSGRQLSLLGVLLLHPNETVSVDRLVDELWGEPTCASSQAGAGLRVRVAEAAGGRPCADQAARVPRSGRAVGARLARVRAARRPGTLRASPRSGPAPS